MQKSARRNEGSEGRQRNTLLVAGSKYASVQAQVDRPMDRRGCVQTPGQRRPSAPANIFVPRLGKELRFEEWYWKELREGGYLETYLRQEKHLSRRRMRAVAREMDGFEQNKKSDFRLKAAIPAREFFRWKREDPDFWADDNNLRSFKRDNPDACVYV
jgi:hypothetical protein